MNKEVFWLHIMPVKGDTYLFDLIHALTMQEKIELHKHAFAGKANNIYFKIYKIIEALSEYDEEVLVKKAKIKKARLPEIKNYLFKIILKTLETIHGHNILEIKNFQEISQILVLGYKGFFDMAYKKLNAAIEKYSASEDYINVLILIQLRDEIVFRFKPAGKSAGDVDGAFKYLTSHIRHFYELSYYRYRFFKATLPLSTYENEKFNLDFPDSVMNASIGPPSKPDTFYKTVLSLRAQCRMAIHEREFNLAENLSGTGIAYVESHPEEIENLPAYFAYGFYNLRAVSCMYTGNYKTGVSAMDKIEEFLKKHGGQYQNNIDFAFYDINRMSYYNLTADFEKTIEVGTSFIKKRKVLLDEFNMYNNMFAYNMALANFATLDYKNALKHIYYFTQAPKEKVVRIDFFMKALLLEILILIEKKELILSESKIRAYERALKVNNRFDDYEKKLCYFLRAYMDKGSDYDFLMEQKHVFKVNERTANSSNYHKRYFDFISWLDSKINKTSFQREMKENQKS